MMDNSKVVLYRPVGNKFIDSRPLAFWQSKEGLNKDFPDTTEIKDFTVEDLESYFEYHDLNLDNMEIYA